VIIDAYSHCGIAKYLPAEQVLAAMNEAGVQRAVLCQQLDDYDNGYLSAVIAKYPERFTAVCLIDPHRADALEKLRQCRLAGGFRGVRLLAGWLGNHMRLYLEAIDLGMNLVIYAPDGIRDAVQPVLDVMRNRPAANLVISHLGNPKVVGQLLYGSELFALADCPNVVVQLSGLSMFCEYPYKLLDRFISEAIGHFGPSRLMWGSNFPVCGGIPEYRRDLDLVQSGAWGLDQDAIQWVIGRTAKCLWFD
jgi:L-fuconolactonase